MANEAEKRSVMRATWLMGAMTLLSRITGLLRETVKAHLLGTGLMADAFAIAYQIPNLFRRLVGEGYMVSAAVPVFQEAHTRGGPDRLNRVVGSFLTLFSLLVTVVCLAGIIWSDQVVRYVFAPGFSSDPDKLALTASMTAWMFPYLLLVSLAALMQAILNRARVFGPSTFAPILMNIAVIVVALFAWRSFDLPVWALVAGVLAGGVLQFGYQIPYVLRLGVSLRPRFDFSDPAVRKIIGLMGVAVLGAGIYQVNVIVSQAIATGLPDGSVAALQFSARLLEFTLGVFVVSIATAALPTFSSFVADGNREGMLDTLAYLLRMTAFLTVPAMVLSVVLRYPVVNMLLRTGRFDQASADLTSHAFLYHSLGLVFIGWGRVLSQAFFALKEQRRQVAAAALSLGVNIWACIALTGVVPLLPGIRVELGAGGIAAANSLSALAQTVALAWLLRTLAGRLAWGAVAGSLARTLAASLVMGAVAWAGARLFDLDRVTDRWLLIPRFALVTGAAGLAFCLAAWLLKSPEFLDLWRSVRRRLVRAAG